MPFCRSFSYLMLVQLININRLCNPHDWIIWWVCKIFSSLRLINFALFSSIFFLFVHWERWEEFMNFWFFFGFVFFKQFFFILSLQNFDFLSKLAISHILSNSIYHFCKQHLMLFVNHEKKQKIQPIRTKGEVKLV